MQSLVAKRRFATIPPRFFNPVGSTKRSNEHFRFFRREARFFQHAGFQADVPAFGLRPGESRVLEGIARLRSESKQYPENLFHNFALREERGQQHRNQPARERAAARERGDNA